MYHPSMRIVAMVGVALLCVTSCDGGTEPDAEAKAAAKASPGPPIDGAPAEVSPHASPETLWAGVQQMHEGGDADKPTPEVVIVATFASPDSQTLMTGMVLLGVVMKTSMDGPEQAKAVQQILSKHGLGEGKPKADANPQSPVEEQLAAWQVTLSPVKDKVALLSELQVFIEGPKRHASEVNRELKQLQIEGDRATGSIVSTDPAGREPEPIEFIRIDGKWYIDLLPMFRRDAAKRKAPPPAP